MSASWLLLATSKVASRSEAKQIAVTADYLYNR
jgi:hypothetical protein